MKSILNDYANFTETLAFLMDISESDAGRPISEGKWSTKEVIAHIYQWDVFLMQEGVPGIFKDNNIVFPNHDQYNEDSVIFSKTINFKTLVKMTAELRIKFVKMLSELNLDEPIMVNGLTADPHTNQPYTLHYLIDEFIKHDHHHFNQIEKYIIRK